MKSLGIYVKTLVFAAIVAIFEIQSSVSVQFNLSVEIFLDESKAHLSTIVESAASRFQDDRRKDESASKLFNLSFSQTTLKGPVDRLLTLDQQINSNSSSSFRAAIFVDISIHSLFLSSIMEKSNISTIGLFQTGGLSTTQENLASFTRVAIPSAMHYACVARDLLRKMGCRTLRLVLAADYYGKVLADTMFEFSKQEKWKMRETAWLIENENSTGLESVLKQILSNESDVVFVHMNNAGDNSLFQLAQVLRIRQMKTAWLLTDVTAQSVTNTGVLPSGVIALAPRQRLQPDLVGNVLYDAFFLLESSFEIAAETAQEEREWIKHTKDAQKSYLKDLAKEKIQTQYFRGKTSVFTEPRLGEGPFSTSDILALKKDLDAIKRWSTIGLKTHSGIALETFEALNGNILTPPVEDPKPVLRVPVVLYSPWVNAEEPLENYGNTTTCAKRGCFCYNKTADGIVKLCCFGLSIDLLKILERELRFTSEIYFVADEQHGELDEETGQWNGIINELISGRGDLALDLALSGQRAQYVEFSFSYIPLALNILVEREEKIKAGIQWDSWLQPFSVQLWWAIIATCNTILIIIWWLDRKSPTGHYHLLRESEEGGFTLLDAMSYIWGLAFSKDIGAERTPRSFSARFVSTVYAFAALILVNTYSANLMAFLVQDEVILPITGITDPKIRDQSPGGFRLGVLQGSFVEKYFKNHISAEFRQIYHTNLKINLMNSFDDGVQKLFNGEIQGLVGDYLSLRQAGAKDHNCRCALAGPNFYTYGLGFAVPKGSPWLDEISRVVLEMKANGSINQLESTYFIKNLCRKSLAHDFSILTFSGLFITVAVTVGFCFLGLVVEVTTLFVLVRFGRYLGVLGKFSVRLLFDLEKGEEHLIALKNPMMQRKRCPGVHMNIVKLTTDLPNESPEGLESNAFVTSNTQSFEDGRTSSAQESGFRQQTGRARQEHENGLVELSRVNGGMENESSSDCMNIVTHL